MLYRSIRRESSNARPVSITTVQRARREPWLEVDWTKKPEPAPRVPNNNIMLLNDLVGFLPKGCCVVYTANMLHPLDNCAVRVTVLAFRVEDPTRPISFDEERCQMSS